MVTVKSGDTMLKAENLFYSYDNGVKQIDTVLDNLNLNIKIPKYLIFYLLLIFHIIIFAFFSIRKPKKSNTKLLFFLTILD